MSTTTSDTAVQPYRVEIDQAALDDLQSRLARVRWPDELPDAGWEYGVPVDYVRGLVDHWRDGYDWRAHEARLNAHPQFTTTIDGQRVHFLHVRSPEPGALPLICTHGWPMSVFEYLDLIGPLSDPGRHGGDPADAFHLVIPSIPGVAFSGPTTEPGWDTRRVARAWVELMARLGYDRYGAHGNDGGSQISPEVGRFAPEQVVGVHVTQLFSFPSGDPAEFADMSEEDMAAMNFLQTFTEGGGLAYNAYQSASPRRWPTRSRTPPPAGWPGSGSCTSSGPSPTTCSPTRRPTGSPARSARRSGATSPRRTTPTVPPSRPRRRRASPSSPRTSSRSAGSPTATTPTSSAGTTTTGAATSRPTTRPTCCSTTSGGSSARCAPHPDASAVAPDPGERDGEPVGIGARVDAHGIAAGHGQEIGLDALVGADRLAQAADPGSGEGGADGPQAPPARERLVVVGAAPAVTQDERHHAAATVLADRQPVVVHVALPSAGAGPSRPAVGVPVTVTTRRDRRVNRGSRSKMAATQTGSEATTWRTGHRRAARTCG